ncbi:MAG: polyphosphate polymerase domain-containing protein [Lachnospiraceae bacterium]|nr:polyphosphate polymerase domain-containing protein [Lachnospiraceae bacterium]
MDKIKYRNELKYLCSEQQLCLLEMRIRHLCSPDPHAGEDGRYTVRSLYFDDYWNSCYYDNENGIGKREKFRLRIYDGNITPITLECKQKLYGKNHKLSHQISHEQCEDILKERFQVPEETDQVLHKFFLAYRTKLYRPKVIVEYERTPYIYPTGNVRITLDRNITASSHVRDFLTSRLMARPVMPAGIQLLEVKYDELLPNYIYDALQLDSLQLTQYSKYYMARKFTAHFSI